ncbi:MAG: hemolysin III family protein [Bacteroidales bacterium]|nr:hemolysin III family protein [Bacteroidales bacterium]
MNETARFTYREEVANAISHLVGAFLSVAALTLMIVFSAKNGSAWHVVSTAVFGSTLIVLYLSSTFTHWLKPGRIKETFFTIDQIAIFFLIAGTYTPLALVAMHGTFGWIVFGIEWGLALTGSLIRISRPREYNSGVNLFYIILYAVMGWLFVFAIVPIIKSIPLMGVIWILIGGLFYTIGIFFYKKATFRYHHLVWHLMVLAGSISHFIAIFFYVIPISL